MGHIDPYGTCCPSTIILVEERQHEIGDVNNVDPPLLHRRLGARVIMGDDEATLLRLWREKGGEIEPEDLSGNLIQLGVVTEPPSRHWYERAKTRRGYFRLACRGFRSRM